jgi:hypothetical protein
VDRVLEFGSAESAPAGGRAGGGLLVNVSRGIASAAVEDTVGTDPGHLVARLSEAAKVWAGKLPVLP